MKKEFILTEENKKAIEIYELAGYTVKLGGEVFGNGYKSWSLWEKENRLEGSSSTISLDPKSAMRMIKFRSWNKGHDCGQLAKQEEIKTALGL